MKTIRYFIQLLTVVLLIGCSEDELIKSGNSVRIFAEMPSTRITYTSDGNAVQASWDKGDEIGLYIQHKCPNGMLPYRASYDGKETEFVFEANDTYPNPSLMKEGDVVYACYPSAPGNASFPRHDIRDQYYSNNLVGTDYLYAKGVVENNKLSLQFKHIYSFLQITIPVDLLEKSEKRGLLLTLNPLKGFIPNRFNWLEGKFDYTYSIGSTIHYFIPSDAELGGKKEIVCNIVIPPLEEGLEVQIYTHFETQTNNNQTYQSWGECLLTKKTPVGGFKAGNVYTLYLNESETEQTRAEEKNALIAFYQATDGDNWTRNDNWCSDKPVEEWYGIKINNRDGSRVTEIELTRNNLCGQFSDVLKALAPLSSLEKLNLWGNNLRGTIPEEIGNFQSLTLLNLYSNDELTGTLPKSIEKLTNLYELNLGMNNFYGEVPNFGEMLNLGSINLGENQFSGEFPDLSKLTKLRFLSLDDNKFTGPLPGVYNEKKAFMSSLTYSVENNLFTGNIPLSHLNWFVEDSYYLRYEVNYNNLSGTLPQELVEHPTFHAHWTSIVGQNPGYGFDRVDLPAHKNTVQCYDDSFLNLGEEYAKNEYTILFRWKYDCGFSRPYPPLIKDLYEHYKSKGLGLAIMTPRKYSYAERSYITELMPDVPFFWEQPSGTYDIPADHHNNNPYSGTNGGGTLFDVLATPYFFIVDKSGHVIYYGSGDHYEGTVPQFHHDRDDIYNYVANLFGDESFVPDPDYYTSTDYSKDGEVITMQKATVGKGIDLVFMGEAFVDRDMNTGGKYEQKMQESMECFFSVEPYKTLRNRFNVFAVKVVSPNAELFETGGKTQLRINEEDAIAFEYAKKVPGINDNHLMVSVIYNDMGHHSRSFTSMYSDGSFVGYMKEYFNTFYNVFAHESGGHGFAKLLDEYVENDNKNKTLPESEHEWLDNMWNSYGWGANVDWRSNAAEIKWSHFLNDDRYKNEVGIYEGAFLYTYGAYRPTENSMMRYNDSPFNAPSREAIYKAIMSQSEGEGWTYNFEEFAAYDAINRGVVTRGVKEVDHKKWRENHRPPVFVKGTWHDAKKNNITVPLR